MLDMLALKLVYVYFPNKTIWNFRNINRSKAYFSNLLVNAQMLIFRQVHNINTERKIMIAQFNICFID